MSDRMYSFESVKFEFESVIIHHLAVMTTVNKPNFPQMLLIWNKLSLSH